MFFLLEPCYPYWKELLDQAPPLTIPKHHTSQTSLLHPLEPTEPHERAYNPNDVNDDPIECDAPEWPSNSDDVVSNIRKAAASFLLALRVI